MLYVRGFLFLCLAIVVGCDSQTSDDADIVSSTIPASLTSTITSYDFGFTSQDTTINATFIINNIGGFNASGFQTNNTTPFRFKGFNFPGTGGDCSELIAPDTSCSLVIEFAPISLDSFNENFNLNYFDGKEDRLLIFSFQGQSILPASPPTSIVLKNPVSSPSNDSTPQLTISGGDISNGQNVELFTDNTCTQLVASGTATGSSIDLTTISLPEGIYDFYATTTNSTSSTSSCSVATVNYELSLTPPQPQTLITHALAHNNTSTTPLISWTLSASSNISSQSIGISTDPNGGHEAASFTNLGASTNSYSFSSISLLECTNYYATLFATNTVGNNSIYAVSANPFQIDTAAPTAPSITGLTSVATLLKARNLNFTASSDSCGIAHYELAIGTSNTGANINNTLDWLNIGTPSGTFTASHGNLGASFNFEKDQTYYISIRSQDNSGKTSSISTSSSFTLAPTFNLSSPQAYPDQVDLSWSLPITSGISDYNIYYKLTSASSYTLFSEGISTSQATTVTGLSPATSYDFYIVAKVGSLDAEYSNTLSITTANQPLPPSSIVLKVPISTPSNNTTPELTLSGGSVASGNSVNLFTNSSCTNPNVATGVATGGSIDLTLSSALSEGVHNFYANVTDNLNYTSSCSTVTLLYEVNTTNPNPTTNISHTPSHSSSTTSPPITWSLSTSTDVSQQYIGLSSASTGSDDIASFVTLNNSLTSYTFSGLSLSECTDIYATMYVEDDAGNISSTSYSTTAFVVDSTAPSAAAGLSLSGTPNVTTSPTLSWSTEPADTCGISHYEIAVGTANTGLNLTDTVPFTDIGNPSGNYTLNDGVDGISMSLVPGTDYYISIRAVDNNGNFGSIATSNSFIVVSDFILGLEERLSNSIKISWNAPSTIGVTDYDIFYKESSASSFSHFSDGVSTTRSTEITGLTAGTEYNIYVTAKVGSTTAESSNTITESTGPNLPFFTTNYSAANVGGATGCRVIAFDGSGTTINLNGSLLTTLTNAGDTFDFACAQHDLLESDKPFYANGMRNETNISWASKGFSGKEYVFDFSRSSPQRLHLFAFEASTIQIFKGSTLITSTTLAANTGTATPITITSYGSYKIISNGLIIAFKDGNSTADPMVLAPATREIIGFPSNSARFGVYGNGVNVLSSYATGTPTTSTYNEGNSYSFASTGSLYSGSAQKLTGAMGDRLAANSYADSNGYCSASYASTSKFFKRYILPGNSEWVAIAATEAMSIEIVNAATGVVESTTALNGSSANGVFYKKFTNTTEGRIFRATDPSKKFAMWWEPKSTTSYMQNDDESIMWGSNE